MREPRTSERLFRRLTTPRVRTPGASLFARLGLDDPYAPEGPPTARPRGWARLAQARVARGYRLDALHPREVAWAEALTWLAAPAPAVAPAAVETEPGGEAGVEAPPPVVRSRRRPSPVAHVIERRDAPSPRAAIRPRAPRSRELMRLWAQVADQLSPEERRAWQATLAELDGLDPRDRARAVRRLLTLLQGLARQLATAVLLTDRPVTHAEARMTAASRPHSGPPAPAPVVVERRRPSPHEPAPTRRAPRSPVLPEPPRSRREAIRPSTALPPRPRPGRPPVPVVVVGTADRPVIPREAEVPPRRSPARPPVIERLEARARRARPDVRPTPRGEQARRTGAATGPAPVRTRPTRTERVPLSPLVAPPPPRNEPTPPSPRPPRPRTAPASAPQPARVRRANVPSSPQARRTTRPRPDRAPLPVVERILARSEPPAEPPLSRTTTRAIPPDRIEDALPVVIERPSSEPPARRILRRSRVDAPRTRRTRPSAAPPARPIPVAPRRPPTAPSPRPRLQLAALQRAFPVASARGRRETTPPVTAREVRHRSASDVGSPDVRLVAPSPRPHDVVARTSRRLDRPGPLRAPSTRRRRSVARPEAPSTPRLSPRARPRAAPEPLRQPRRPAAAGPSEPPPAAPTVGLTASSEAARPGLSRIDPSPDGRDLLTHLLRREQALLAAAAELPRASEQAARRILEAARRLAVRPSDRPPVDGQPLQAAPSATPSGPTATQFRWSRTHRRAQKLADELMQLLKTSQNRRRDPAPVRLSTTPVHDDEASYEAPVDEATEGRNLEAERAFATLLRDVVAEIRHHAPNWLSGDPYG